MAPSDIGYEEFIHEFSSLISLYPPPFLYVNDSEAFRTTRSVIQSSLATISNKAASPSSSKVIHAAVDAVACFTPRLLYDSIINQLAGWTPKWEEGCRNWSGNDDEEGDGKRWNESFDGFLHGLRAVHLYLRKREMAINGSSSEAQDGNDRIRFVIVVERADRLKDTLGELVAPLTRLKELARLDLCTVFLSEMMWEDMKPSLGASPDPYFMDIQPLSKDVVVKRLISAYSSPSLTGLSEDLQETYDPSLKPLYSHFITALCDVCFPFTHDPSELQCIAAARWPGFVKPVLDEHHRKMKELREERGNAMDLDEDEKWDELEPDLLPPAEDIRMRLVRMFIPSLTNALETLLPRLTNATDWAAANVSPDDLLAHHGRLLPSKRASADDLDPIKHIQSLPRMARFILVAAFLASTNPAKSDLRMFGRGLDEKKRKRRRVVRQIKSGAIAKVPQRLLGPSPFPVDRLIAILGVLLEENDAESREDSSTSPFTMPGEATDMEIGRIGIYATIMQLVSMRLLHRTSPADRLDGPPTFKCAVSYDTALSLAKQLDVPLNDLLWDPL